MAVPPQDLTERLQRWGSGDKAVLNDIVSVAYDELRTIAGAYLKRETRTHTLQATALVNELYIRLARIRDARFSDRKHFYAFTAHLMRIMLIDSARRSKAARL